MQVAEDAICSDSFAGPAADALEVVLGLPAGEADLAQALLRLDPVAAANDATSLLDEARRFAQSGELARNSNQLRGDFFDSNLDVTVTEVAQRLQTEIDQLNPLLSDPEGATKAGQLAETLGGSGTGQGLSLGAVSEFQTHRQLFQSRDYQQVQEVYWQSLRQKRGPPTPIQSGLTTPQEVGRPTEMECDTEGQAASSDPSLLMPFTLQDQAALDVTIADFGINPQDTNAVNTWLETAPTNRQVMQLVRSYHKNVIRPEYYTLVFQLEAGLRHVGDSVFKVSKDLAWMAADNRLAQKHQCGLQLLTTGWPTALQPSEREYQLCWMLSAVPKVQQFLQSRGFISDHNAAELHRFLNALSTEPVTVPQSDGFYSPMTMITFKSWEIRQAFLERFGGSTGCPVYKDDSTPIHGKHVKVSPSSPQWQRKLESPLRVLLACINAHPDHNATSRLTILWKTLTLLEPKQDSEFHEDVKAWARLFYSEINGRFSGRLEIVADLQAIVMSPPSEAGSTEDSLWNEQWNRLMFGPQRELDAMEAQAFKAAGAEAGPGGKGMSLGKGKRHWSQAAIYSSDYRPYPFDLEFVTVDAVHFCWDEMCDKFKVPEQRIGDYSVATTQGKPPSAAGAELRSSRTEEGATPAFNYAKASPPRFG
ncbi:unnamed protein product [Symbiodinium microadriaticum]|nr:unnamed protein product [Symbiodinium microadriaticum]CAE7942343.1 unnamed protein product [Symbiodinium sp. KB8]